jgi:von Willebrand factor type A domain
VMAPLKVQLQQSIDKLSPMQSFNVIFFSDEGSVSALNPQHPLLASPENKRKAYDFLAQVAAAGSTDPYKAIKMAFVQKPDLLFVLTDGFDQVASIDDVVNEFSRDNPGGKAKVNTLLLRRNEDETFVAPLQKIAQDGHGVYKPLRPEDF